MTTTTIDIDKTAPAGEQSRAWADVLRSEPVVLAALAVSLGLYYLGPGPSFVVGAVAFFALTLYRPDLQLAMVPLAAPLFYRPRAIGPYFFSLAEFVIVCGVAAWALRDGWALVRTRSMPMLREMVRQPGVWLAGALALTGLLWLLVPDAAHRKVAIYDFWRTVVSPILFFLLVLRWLRTERDLWRMTGAWLIAAALVGREAVEQYLFGQTSFMEGVGRVVSVYPSATALGIYLGRALALGIVLAFFLPSGWRTWKIAAAALSLVIGLGTVFSFARGAWIGVVVALAVVGLITRSRPLLATLGAGLLAGLAALPFIHVERITSLFNFTGTENTGLARTQIWASALRILRDHPFTGIGQDQFLYQDPKYGVPQARLLITAHPHNWILDFWLRLGLPGVAWIVMALAYFFWQCIGLWQRHRNTELGALALALLASMIDFAVHGLVDMAYFTMDLALTFWLTMGLLLVLKRLPPAPSSAK
jgi:putative inorganic carbon (HCO3(-)) transporter